jgi:hypothetical protein
MKHPLVLPTFEKKRTNPSPSVPSLRSGLKGQGQALESVGYKYISFYFFPLISYDGTSLVFSFAHAFLF